MAESKTVSNFDDEILGIIPQIFIPNWTPPTSPSNYLTQNLDEDLNENYLDNCQGIDFNNL